LATNTVEVVVVEVDDVVVGPAVVVVDVVDVVVVDVVDVVDVVVDVVVAQKLWFEQSGSAQSIKVSPSLSMPSLHLLEPFSAEPPPPPGAA
jgi:hypothetical protein